MSRIREFLSLGKAQIVYLVVFLLVAFVLNLLLMDVVEDWFIRTVGSIIVGSVVAAGVRWVVSSLLVARGRKGHVTSARDGDE